VHQFQPNAEPTCNPRIQACKRALVEPTRWGALHRHNRPTLRHFCLLTRRTDFAPQRTSASWATRSPLEKGSQQLTSTPPLLCARPRPCNHPHSVARQRGTGSDRPLGGGASLCPAPLHHRGRGRPPVTGAHQGDGVPLQVMKQRLAVAPVVHQPPLAGWLVSVIQLDRPSARRHTPSLPSSGWRANTQPPRRSRPRAPVRKQQWYGMHCCTEGQGLYTGCRCAEHKSAEWSRTIQSKPTCIIITARA
jgi:hypothetical protein